MTSRIGLLRSLRVRAPALGGLILSGVLFLACVCTLPWTLARSEGEGVPRYNVGIVEDARLPPWWAGAQGEARAKGYWLGSDALGRSLLVRMLVGGAISLGVGFAATVIAVVVGTVYGAVAGLAGGRIDALMMRIVDVLYGLPYVLVVVLLAVAGESLVDEYASRERARAAWVEAHAGSVSEEELHEQAQRELPTRVLAQGTRSALDMVVLLAAIGGVSWLTLARVVRGEVQSLKGRPFIEAARVIGVSPMRLLCRHLLPNLVGPVVVYAALAVPQAMLQEAFLSFLGIGVKPPLPSWGRLAAEGLGEINPYQSHWWLLVFPCAALSVTLVALHFVGEAVREAVDPNRAGRCR
jgi:oligopeptide transport system permease protein